jgi:hypothetical protein
VKYDDPAQTTAAEIAATSAGMTALLKMYA